MRRQSFGLGKRRERRGRKSAVVGPTTGIWLASNLPSEGPVLDKAGHPLPLNRRPPPSYSVASSSASSWIALSSASNTVAWVWHEERIWVAMR